jgi:hypothetical protein
LADNGSGGDSMYMDKPAVQRAAATLNTTAGDIEDKATKVGGVLFGTGQGDGPHSLGAPNDAYAQAIQDGFARISRSVKRWADSTRQCAVTLNANVAASQSTDKVTQDKFGAAASQVK